MEFSKAKNTMTDKVYIKINLFNKKTRDELIITTPLKLTTRDANIHRKCNTNDWELNKVKFI